jgi:hypothetical protein
MRYAVISLTMTLSLFIGVGTTARAAQPTISREGMRDLQPAEVTSLVGKATKDSRYAALQQVAEERGLRLVPAQAAGKWFSEGYRALFVPALDGNGDDHGFLTTSGDVWALSLSLANGPVTVAEGFTAKTGADGTTSIEVAFTTKPESPVAMPYPAPESVSASCQYVESDGFSYGCFALPDNPFGQYYTNIYRYGTDPDSSHVAWWACYQGGIHVCPVTESSGSPLRWVVCGSPPAHPIG